MRSTKFNTGGRPPILNREDVETIVLIITNKDKFAEPWTLKEICRKFGCCSKTFWRSLKKYYAQEPEKLEQIKQQIKLPC